MNNQDVNDRLGEIADGAYTVDGLAVHGKAIPYIGWYWRDVDFDAPVRLGDCGHFVGFMEKNKWDYPQWRTTPEQSATIRRMVYEIATEPTNAHLQAFFDYIQTCKPVDSPVVAPYVDDIFAALMRGRSS